MLNHLLLGRGRLDNRRRCDRQCGACRSLQRFGDGGWTCLSAGLQDDWLLGGNNHWRSASASSTSHRSWWHYGGSRAGNRGTSGALLVIIAFHNVLNDTVNHAIGSQLLAFFGYIVIILKVEYVVRFLWLGIWSFSSSSSSPAAPSTSASGSGACRGCCNILRGRLFNFFAITFSIFVAAFRFRSTSASSGRPSSAASTAWCGGLASRSRG